MRCQTKHWSWKSHFPQTGIGVIIVIIFVTTLFCQGLIFLGLSVLPFCELMLHKAASHPEEQLCWPVLLLWCSSSMKAVLSLQFWGDFCCFMQPQFKNRRTLHRKSSRFLCISTSFKSCYYFTMNALVFERTKAVASPAVIPEVKCEDSGPK